MLSAAVLGSNLASNPALAGLFGGQYAGGLPGGQQGVQPPQQFISGGGFGQMQPINSPQGGFQNYNPFVGSKVPGYQQSFQQGAGQPKVFTPSGGGGDLLGSFAPQGFLQAGQAIPGQIRSNVTQTYRPFQFKMPEVNFQAPEAFQFKQVNPIDVGDIYSPQMNMAARAINEQFGRSRDDIVSQLNKQGLFSTGATTRAVGDLIDQRDRNLANSSDQFALQQAQQGLSEAQQARGLDFQRQQAQAAELFRQQGVSDQQAQFLANLAMQNQQNQFQAFNTADQLRLAQQQAAFQQTLAGRQQATAEEQLANFFRRQPLEDLFRLYGAQTGQIGATEGSSGVLGALGSIGGALAGAFI